MVDGENPIKKIKRDHTTPTSSLKKRSKPFVQTPTVKTSPVEEEPVQPSTSDSSKKRIPKGLSEQARSALESLGWENTEGGYSPKGAAKHPKKRKKTALEKLKEGWESWENPIKRALDYDKKDSD